MKVSKMTKFRKTEKRLSRICIHKNFGKITGLYFIQSTIMVRSATQKEMLTNREVPKTEQSNFCRWVEAVA